jgi:hypothetical protein
MFAAVGSFPIRLYDSGNDVEYGIGALTLMVDFAVFVESGDRCENGQSSALFFAEQLMRFAC